MAGTPSTPIALAATCRGIHGKRDERQWKNPTERMCPPPYPRYPLQNTAGRGFRAECSPKCSRGASTAAPPGGRVLTEYSEDLSILPLQWRSSPRRTSGRDLYS